MDVDQMIEQFQDDRHVDPEPQDTPEVPDDVTIPGTRSELESMGYSEIQKLGGEIGLGGQVIGVKSEDLVDMVWEQIEGMATDGLSADTGSDEPDTADIEVDTGVDVDDTTIQRTVEADIDVEGIEKEVDEAIETAFEETTLGDVTDVSIDGDEESVDLDPTPVQPDSSQTPDADGETAVDGMYLITTEGCPGCQVAKERLSDWIDSGKVEVLDIQADDKAVDIVMELDLNEAPVMVEERDGQYREL